MNSESPQNRTPFVKRLAAFALVMLVLYFVVLAFYNTRQTNRALEGQDTALQEIRTSLDQTRRDLADARRERTALVNIVIEQNELIRSLGGDPIDLVTAGIDDDGDGRVDEDPGAATPNPAPGPPAAPEPPQSRDNSGSDAAPAPRPQPAPTRTQPPSRPEPRPTPTPTPQRLVCINTPIVGQVCTPV